MKLCRTKYGAAYNVFTTTDLYHTISDTLCNDAFEIPLEVHAAGLFSNELFTDFYINPSVLYARLCISDSN
jgi:hypothetical protein